MSDWLRRLYACQVCRRIYPDFIGGSLYCSIGCAYEAGPFGAYRRDWREREWLLTG